MVVVLNHDENILDFLNDDLLELVVTDTYEGYASLEFEYKLTDIRKDKELFCQGNKIFAENRLFIINSDVSFDYVDKIIKVSAEEVIVELNNSKPFYYKDSKYSNHVQGHTINITKEFLEKLLDGFFKVETVNITDKLLITVNGSITKYSLLKEIEKESGLVFQRKYYLEDNKIIKEINLLTPGNYGVTHDNILDSIQYGENTNELQYSSDETKNAAGISVIINSEKEKSSSKEVDYDKILSQFSNLDVNSTISPVLYKYDFFKSDIKTMATNLAFYVENNKHLPERITISHKELLDSKESEQLDTELETNSHNKIYSVEIGMGQAMYLMAASITSEDNVNIELEHVECAAYTKATVIKRVFEVEEIKELATKTYNHCLNLFKAPSFYSTKNGQLSFQGLTYLFAKYLSTEDKVFYNSHVINLLDKINPKFIQENITYLEDYDNYESMPFMYTQNTNDSSNIPVSLSPIQLTGSKTYDVDKYISESYPVLIVKKKTNSSVMGIEIESQGISDDNIIHNSIFFKDPSKIQNDAEITIDFNNKSIKLMKYVNTTTTKEVTNTVKTGNSNVITAQGYPTCACCARSGKSYKKHVRTYVDKCPICGRTGTLVFNPKGVADGEITCGNTGPACRTGGTKNGKSYKRGSIRGCDADFCVDDGGCKGGLSWCRKYKLTPGEAQTTTTQTKTVTETKGEFKEVTADLSGDSSDSKVKLYDVITAQSKLEAWYGDVSFKLKGLELVSLKCESTKQFEFSRFPYVKPCGELYIYSPLTKVDFNYLRTEDSPKLESFETTEQSVEEVLIGAWQKLNGSGDDTKWLEKNEDITVKLVETKGKQYNVGDFVYIKLPNQEVFKAQITEISYNPKLVGDKEIKIGNVKRSSII